MSVILPVLNGERFLPEAISSILNQEDCDLQLVVVDDGSTDGTREIIDDFARRDGRVTSIRHDRPQGICNALNAAAAGSNGEYLARMDADDISEPNRLRTQLALLVDSPELVAVGSWVRHIDETGRALSLHRQGPVDIFECKRLMRQGKIPVVPHPTLVMRRAAFEEVGGYDARFALAEDLDLYSRLTAKGPIVSIPLPLLRYRVHPGSESMSKFYAQRRMARDVFVAHHARIASIHGVGSAEERGAAALCVINRRVEKAQFHYRAAGLAYGQRKWGSVLVHLASSIVHDPAYAPRRLYSQRKGKND